MVQQWIQTFYETHIAYRLALIHFYSDTLSSKLPTQTQQLYYFALRTSFSYETFPAYTGKHRFH